MKLFGWEFYWELWVPFRHLRDWQWGTDGATGILLGKKLYTKQIWVGPFYLAACRCR